MAFTPQNKEVVIVVDMWKYLSKDDVFGLGEHQLPNETKLSKGSH